jgi:hypothetical protein
MLASTAMLVFSLSFTCFLFVRFFSMAANATGNVSWATAVRHVAAGSTAAATTASSALTKSSAAGSIGNADDEMDFRRAAPPLALRLDLTAGFTGATNTSSAWGSASAATAAADVVIGTVVGEVAGTVVAAAAVVVSSAAVDFFFPFFATAETSALVDAQTASLALVAAAKAVGAGGGDGFEGNEADDDRSSAIAKENQNDSNRKMFSVSMASD